MSLEMTEKFHLTEENIPIVKQMAEAMPNGFIIYKADAGEEILYANRPMLRICECADMETLKRMTGNSYRGLILAEDYEAFMPTVQNYAASSREQTDFIEYRIRPADGSVRWVSTYGHLLHTDMYGDVYCVFISDSTDQTLRMQEDRRKAEIIQGLGRDFNSIYLVDFETQKMIPYSLNNSVAKSMRYAFNKSLDYEITIREFADTYVCHEDLEQYILETSEERIRERIKTEHSYDVLFRRYNERHALEYVQMTISRVDDKNRFNRIVMAYKNVTGYVETAQEELIRRRTKAILRAVTDEYICLVDVNRDTHQKTEFFMDSAATSPLPRWSEEVDYTTWITDYAYSIVLPEDRERFIAETNAATIREALSSQEKYTVTYRINNGDTVQKITASFVVDHDETDGSHLLILIR